jgi:hypothetical protein
MKRTIRRCLFVGLAVLGIGFSEVAQADEREELKARIAELEKEAERMSRAGEFAKVGGLMRERMELAMKLSKMQFEENMNRRGDQGPAMPKERQENPFSAKQQRAKEQINHLRVASEHLKLAQKHDMAMELMKQAQQMEMEIREAAANRERQERQERQEVIERQSLEKQSIEKQRRERMQRANAERDSQRGPAAGGEEALRGVRNEIEQLREENRATRQMLERISQELKKMKSRGDN